MISTTRQVIHVDYFEGDFLTKTSLYSIAFLVTTESENNFLMMINAYKWAIKTQPPNVNTFRNDKCNFDVINLISWNF